MFKAIREALATTIYEATDRKVNAYWSERNSPALPAVMVRPHPDKYVDLWGTFGPNGLADAMLQLVVEVQGQDVPALAEQLDKLISVGEAETMSIIDPIMANRTLGGLVEDCVPLNVRIPDEFEGVAYVDVQLIIRKQNAGA